MEKLILVAYTVPLGLVLLLSLVQLNLVFNYLRHRRAKNSPAVLVDEEMPWVTVQLPLYNERYVVERLLDCIARLDYPRNRFEIQVLDDSTDETVELVTRKREELTRQGLIVRHIRRSDRSGFKAGALAEGLKTAQGEFVAVFDADFLPNPDFLRKTIPHFFTDPRLGMVQTRWEYLNKDYSVLTKIQAFALDGHFIVEQQGRNVAKHFINFNGTGGVWRKSCIADAGGWQADTLTEDLDLSYRAQLKGWRFEYLEKTGSPAELPVEMNALKSQQYRWTKGAAECARKHVLNILKAPKVAFGTKLHASAHLLYSLTFVCLVLLAVLSIPVLYVATHSPQHRGYFEWMAWFQVSSVILALFYWVAYQNANQGATFGRFLLDYLVFITLWMGLSLHNAVAVIEGYAGRKTPFVRTPKFGVIGKTDAWQANTYRPAKVGWLTYIEGLLAVYFIAGLGLGWYWHNRSFMPFHFMLALGFGLVFYFSVRHAWQGQAQTRYAPTTRPDLQTA